MKGVFYIFILLTFMMYSCKTNDEATEMATNNPLLLKNFGTPFNVPPFDLIKDEYFLPAFEKAMQEHNEEISAIVNNGEIPDFQNTIIALEEAGRSLNQVSTIFFNLSAAHTNDQIKEISQKIAPQLAKHNDAITMNADLFKKVESVYKNRSNYGLNVEQERLLDKTYKMFVRNGALLSPEQQERVSEINQELSLLTVKFGQNNLAEINSWEMVIDNESDLSGLPAEIIAVAADDAKAKGHEGKWLFTLANPSVMPFLQYADNRNLREKIWRAYTNRANNDNENNNKDIINKIVNLRLEKANLLGYSTHADFVLEERMAKNAENVYKLLDQLWMPAIEKAKIEAAEIQNMINQEKENFKLEPWDWRYYAEKVRKAKFDIDEQEVKTYFSLEKVTQGIFDVSSKLFGVNFKKIKDVPKYHPDVEVIQVTRGNGELVGILYMDFHPRESKRGGAWMTSYSEQRMENGKRIAPVISIVCNFSKPSGDTPSLLTFDEVTTYFHEFGHALHGLLSNVTYESQSGTNVPTDFVELPSQIMENWAAEPEVLSTFAKHYQTGEVIPAELLQKIKDAGNYGMGFATVEYLASSYLDLAYHTIKNRFDQDPVKFENEYLNKKGLIDEIVARHRSTYFNHIFSGGYSAGYYSYIWSEVLDSDAFQAFKETSLFDKATADSFRTNILERGGTDDPMEMYKRFRGAEPNINALLVKRGFSSKGS